MQKATRKYRAEQAWNVPSKLLIALVIAATVLLATLAYHHFFPSRPAATEADLRWRQARQANADREFPEAIAHLTHCLEAWPFNAEAHFLMARTCRRAGHLNLWKKHLDRAEALNWPALQIDLERKLRRAQVGDVWGG